jgi:hypothetical protein
MSININLIQIIKKHLRKSQVFKLKVRKSPLGDLGGYSKAFALSISANFKTEKLKYHRSFNLAKTPKSPKGDLKTVNIISSPS